MGLPSPYPLPFGEREVGPLSRRETMVPGPTAQRTVGSGREGWGEGESFVISLPSLPEGEGRGEVESFVPA